MHLVVLFGPPAVGKMTVGHELCRLTGYRLFHNHLTIEPFLGIFEFGSPSFARLSSEFRLAEKKSNATASSTTPTWWRWSDT